MNSFYLGGMKATLMQMDLVWADPQANRNRIEEKFSTLSPTDLVVLPEMFSTGFVTKPEGVAEKDCATLQWMKEQSSKYGFAIAGSVSTEEDGRFYNRLYFVTPDGQTTFYDKRHLFSYSGEDKLYTPGASKVIVEWSGVKILLQVCYDLRFPETARNGIMPSGEAEYDLAIYVASWPVRRVAAWSSLLVARAIENQCYVLGVNRVGSDPSCEYTGATAAIDPYGATIASCKSGEEDIIQVDINLDSLASFRASFPVLADIIPW